MAEPIFDLNDIAHLTVEFTVSGVDTDPTTVTGSVRKPDGTITAYTVTTNQIVKDSTGKYHLDVTVDQPGHWAYKLVGTGVATDTGEGTFYVNPDGTAVTANLLYVTPEELKDALSLTGQSYATIDINRAVAAASRAIDNATNRFFYSATQTHYYSPDWRDTALDTIDITTLTSFAVDDTGDSSFGTTWLAGTDFDLEPYNAALINRPYECVRLRWQAGRRWPNYRRSVKVIGTFGWPAVPDPVNQYAVILASKLLKRSREAPFGVLAYALDTPLAVRIARTDPDFNLLLGDYVKSSPGF